MPRNREEIEAILTTAKEKYGVLFGDKISGHDIATFVSEQIASRKHQFLISALSHLNNIDLAAVGKVALEPELAPAFEPIGLKRVKPEGKSGKGR